MFTRLLRSLSPAHLPVAGLVACGLLAACDEDPEECWLGLDTLYVTGITVNGVSDVQTVFNAYLASVDSTGTALPDSALKWTFERAEFNREYAGKRYWRLWHTAEYSWTEAPLLRRLLDVDEGGALVAPLGCI